MCVCVFVYVYVYVHASVHRRLHKGTQLTARGLTDYKCIHGDKGIDKNFENRWQQKYDINTGVAWNTPSCPLCLVDSWIPHHFFLSAL